MKPANLADFIKHLIHAFAVYDRDLVNGTVIVSDTWMTLTRLDPSKITDPQQEFMSRVHVDDLAQLMASDGKAISGETDRTITEVRFHAGDRTIIWLRSDGIIAERSDDGTAVRLLGTMVDITSAKLAAAALQASEERFRATIQIAPVGMALVSHDGTITSANAALCRFLGYAENGLVTRNFRTLVRQSDALDGQF